MTANYVNPFEVFRSFVEFYPKLGATIAFGTMATAARMIPTSDAAIGDAPEAKGPELVSSANIPSPRKRSVLGSEVLLAKHGAKPPSEQQAAGRPPRPIACRTREAKHDDLRDTHSRDLILGRSPGQGRQPAWIAAWPLFDLLIGRGTPDCYIKLRNRGWVKGR